MRPSVRPSVGALKVGSVLTTLFSKDKVQFERFEISDDPFCRWPYLIQNSNGSNCKKAWHTQSYILSTQVCNLKHLSFRQSIRESITVIPIVSDIDIYINGGLELEEVEVEIKAIDQEFVPTVQGTCIKFATDY